NRPAETAARGYIIKMLANINNENNAWKTYSIKATMIPTCIEPVSIKPAPNQRIAIITVFNNRENRAGVTEMVLNNVPDCFLKDLLTSLTRPSRKCSLLKARITRKPVMFSRRIRLILSKLVCCFSEIGKVYLAIKITDKMIIIE